MHWIKVNFCRAVWIYLLVLKPGQLVEAMCNNSNHEEVTMPKITNHIGSLSDLRYSKKQLRLSLAWRHETLHLILDRHDIVPEGAISEWGNSDNTTEVELLADNQLFYQGHVRGKRFSYAAISILTGLTGYIQIDNEGIYIEPTQNTKRSRRILGSHLLQSCGNSSTHKPNQTNGSVNYNGAVHRRTRSRRAPGQYTKYLEVLIVADSTVVEFVGTKNVKSYLLTLMNIVNTVYHDDSLGANIEVVTVKIMYMDKATERSVVSTRQPQRTVDNFCEWASTRSYRSRRHQSSSNHDVAVLLTRSKFAPAGYAPITGMCIPMRNCALVKDDGFTSAFVIAHEIGHIFGLMHDGHGNNCHGREYATSIMATMVQSSFHHYWWSDCSKSRMAQVINHLHCLNNNPHNVIKDELALPLGKSWSLDQQCRLEFGDTAKHCRVFRNLDPCAAMWCSERPDSYTCKTKNVVPLEGTQCGSSSQWYCQSGNCGYHGNEKPIDGGWSEWGVWSNCSSACGIGFKRRSRLCNSPKPKFNGKECDGISENADTCKARTCVNYVDERAYQCRVMDIVPVKGKTYEWLPYQIEKVADQCKLTCISKSTSKVFTFDSLVNNGIPCSYDEPYSICMDGSCKEIGCDGIQGSTRKEDACGVCGGNNSTCKTVSGHYRKKFEYSAAKAHYENIIVIPKGSRDIKIKEKENLPHFLSLQETAYYNHVLNGEGRQGRSKNFVVDGAWFKYTNNAGLETLISGGPIHRQANLMIYPMDWTRPANVEFSYTTTQDDFTYEKNKYFWEYEDWSPCSVSCGKGVQHIVYGCYDKEANSKVEKDKCRFLDAPNTEDVACERVDCNALNYIWSMKREFSKCSTSCGDGGFHHQLYGCERLTDGIMVDQRNCEHIPPPIVIEPCNRKPCVSVVYKWSVTTTWSKCSATCGDEGAQYQLFYCARDVGNGKEEKTDELYCSDIPSPKEERPCNRLPCITYRWELSDDWNSCNETCGATGMQLREAVCKKIIGGDMVLNTAIWNCDEDDKPKESRQCNRRVCYQYKWQSSGEWGECNQTCGNEGIRYMRGVCKNVTYDDREIRVADQFCNADSEPCNVVPCQTFTWKQTDRWSECSERCGDDGYQTRIYQCESTERANTSVEEGKCKDAVISREKRNCNRVPCHSFHWQIEGEWKPECQTNCSGEIVSEQTRNVICSQKFINNNTEQTDDSFCNEELKPKTVRECSVIECSRYRWNIRLEHWSQCTTTCGEDGTQTQLVECVEETSDGRHEVVSKDKCNIETMPTAVIRACDAPPCIRYEDESVIEWSQCSVTCGEGFQYQSQRCVQTLSNGKKIQVPQVYCEQANLTRTTRICEQGPCGYLEWGAGRWSMCSKTCGAGRQKRVVYCGSPHNQSHISRCPGKAPAEYRDCDNEPCTDDNRKKVCTRDRAPFCIRASARVCAHPVYLRVCCKSCQKFVQAGDQPSTRRRNVQRSSYTNYRRLYQMRRRRRRRHRRV